jgi:predicted RNA-binding Zn ribbon-like protein
MVTHARPTVRETQPGGREPAPGDLALVQSFLNSRWDLDRDQEEQLTSPDALARWLGDHGLLDGGAGLREADLIRAREVREGLRALLFANNGEPLDREAVEGLNRALGRLTFGVGFGADGAPGVVPRGQGLDGALAAIASIVAVAQVDGTWSRLKACPGRRCGWAFYDHSRNRRGSWCTMSACGQRAKAREYRRRKRVPGGSDLPR